MKLRNYLRDFKFSGRLAVLVLVLFCLFAIYGLWTGNFADEKLGPSLTAPCPEYPLGTDDLGRDVFQQLAAGASFSLFLGFSCGLFSGLGGSLLGIFAAYRGGVLDSLLTALLDLLQAMPTQVVVIVFVAYFPSSTINLIVLISIFMLAGVARTVRAKTRVLMSEKFITASENMGAGFFHLLKRHFLLLLSPLILVEVIRVFSHAVVMEAGLSFLGLANPSQISWGKMLNRALGFPGIYFSSFWLWWVLPPLFMIISLVLAVAFIAREIEAIGRKF